MKLLRSRPALAFWLAAIAQALLWTLVPALFYAGPPGDVPNVLAVGHEFQLGTYLGPPLAFWLAEIAFDIAGRSLFGVYLLSQACVVVTYWAVFALGALDRRRAACGARGAADGGHRRLRGADAGIRARRFSPCRCGRSCCCITGGRSARNGALLVLLAIEIGLLLLTTYVGLILVGCWCCSRYEPSARARELRSYDPWIAAGVAIVRPVSASDLARGPARALARAHAAARAGSGTREISCAWLRQVTADLRRPRRSRRSHRAGGRLAVAATRAGAGDRARSRWILRTAVRLFLRLAPAFAGTLIAVLIGMPGPIGGVAPLIVLSGLLAVVAAGEGIRFSRQHVVIATWSVS